jgi:ATP-dependent helicase/DNAse subunit B
VRQYAFFMPITLVTGPANAGKAQVVLDGVRASRARAEEPILVVPTQVDVEHYRRELADGGLIMGARVEGFDGLMGEIIRRSARRDRALGEIARERVLGAVAARTEMPVLGRSRGTPGFTHALASFVAELEVERVTPGRLRQALRAWSAEGASTARDAGRAREMSDLFEAYHRILEKLGRVDPEQRASRALDAIRRSPAAWGATPVLLYGFDDLTPLQLDTIETLGRVVGAPVTVSLSYEPGRLAFAGRAGAFQQLLPLASAHRDLAARAEYYAPQARGALHHLERWLLEDNPPARSVDAGVVRLLEGGGERAELELVAGEIRALLDSGEMAPEEIAVVHRRPAVIADLLGEVLDAFSIPYALQRGRCFADTAIGRALIGLLAVAVGAVEGQPEGSLEDLLAWLRAPGVLEHPELADRLEAQARRLGASSGSQARALWEAEHWPLDRFERISQAARASSSELLEQLARELQWLFDAPRRRRASVLSEAELDEARALAAGRQALEELSELVRAIPDLAPDPRELADILRTLQVRGGERPGPGTVAVLDPLALRARRVRALFLCGLQEGEFPAASRPEPFLSEDERRGLAEASGLRLGAHQETLATERYLLYAAVSRPEELLVLSWHVATDDGVATAPSLFVADVCDLFEDGLREQTVHRALGAVAWPGSGARPQATALASVGLGATEGGLASRLEPLRDERLLAELDRDRLWSASALETWAGCPARWFVERMLRAEDLDPEPEPLARGGLAHAALRDTLEGLRLQTGSARLTPGNLGRARELLREALKAHAEDFPLSVSPERVPGTRRRLEVDLERYLQFAAQREDPLEPFRLELAFGFAEEQAEGGLPPLDLGDGVRLRGRIDRVDVSPDGELVVYDYKSSRALDVGKWLGERSLQVALYMRVLEEHLQAKVVGGFYQPLSGRDLRARGVLAADSEVELECVRGDVRERAEFELLLDQAVVAAREAAREARGGALEARPGTCGFGDGKCMYPSICRCER